MSASSDSLAELDCPIVPSVTPSLLAMEPPNIVFQVEGRVDVSRTFLQLKAAKSLRLVQIDTPLFAFEPVLKTLQKMRFLPLSDEILFWEKGKMVKGPLSPSRKLPLSSLRIHPLISKCCFTLRLP